MPPYVSRGVFIFLKGETQGFVFHVTFLPTYQYLIRFFIVISISLLNVFYYTFFNFAKDAIMTFCPAVSKLTVT